jgi:hypothetical protein
VRAPPSPRALCAPSAAVGNGLWAGSAHLDPCWAKPSGSMARPRRSSACCSLAGRTEFRLDGRLKIEICFIFFISIPIQIQTLKNSYLNIQSSKNYETSFVGFIILQSI